MRPKEGMYLAHGQGNSLPGLLPGKNAHFGVGREHRGGRGDHDLGRRETASVDSEADHHRRKKYVWGRLQLPHTPLLTSYYGRYDSK